MGLDVSSAPHGGPAFQRRACGLRAIRGLRDGSPTGVLAGGWFLLAKRWPYQQRVVSKAGSVCCVFFPPAAAMHDAADA